MSHMPCCGARLNMEGIHKPDCDEMQAQYEELLAEEHRREERVQYEREDQHNDAVRDWELTREGDVRNIPGGY